MGEPASIPLVDMTTVANLKEMLDGQVTDIYQEFLDITPAELSRLRSAANDHDFQSVSKLAHTLKGMGGNLGAAEFSRICLEIELAAKNGQLNDPLAMLDQLSKAFDLTRDEFLNLLSL